MVAIKNKLNNKSVTPERDENKSITLKLDELQACINNLNNIIDKLIKAKVVSYLNSYSSQHPYSYYSSQRSKAKEDPAEEALEKIREEDY